MAKHVRWTIQPPLKVYPYGESNQMDERIHEDQFFNHFFHKQIPGYIQQVKWMEQGWVAISRNPPLRLRHQQRGDSVMFWDGGEGVNVVSL